MIITGQLTVTTTRAKVDGTSPSPCTLVIHNSGTNAVVLGNDTVTANDGFELHTNSTIQIPMPAGESLYAVASSGNHDISWMRISQ
jgi:hypothetical protein